jgi:subtilisin family serine protease
VAEDDAGVDIAILDTGIDTDHCDLAVQGETNCTRKVMDTTTRTATERIVR